MSTSASMSFPIRHIARIVIEFTTPFHVGTGEGGYGADALVITDANGLPAIPGSSLAGALRAAFIAHTRDTKRADNLFGFQREDAGVGSRLSLTWAAIHKSDDQPVDGILDRSSLEGTKADPVLRQALTLQIRDHVRLTHRGGATPGGKFDEQPVAAGHRFTFEMELVDKDDNDWEALIKCLNSPALRLGGKSRRGYGAFRLERFNKKSFNLGYEPDFEAYASHPASLARQPAWLTELQTANPQNGRQSASTRAVTLTIHIKPRGFWMFGGGEDTPPTGADPADMAPLKQDRIVWDDNKGRVESGMLLLPGSAIKGAISHRVAFHFNRLSNDPRDSHFADNIANGCNNDKQGHASAQGKLGRVTGVCNRAVQELFGFVKEDNGRGVESGAARGRVLVDDLFWFTPPPPQQRVPHVSIDRFTGGAMDGRLFCERPLWQGDFPELKITLLDADAISSKTRKALRAALEDIIEGRLALGAGAGRGLGFFEAKANVSKPLECSHAGWFDQPHQS